MIILVLVPQTRSGVDQEQYDRNRKRTANPKRKTNVSPQNLVPLLLRPLRLVVPAELMRSLRIGLLKATHWPFVALILGYENGRQYLNQRRHTSSSSRSLRGPNPARSHRRSVADGLRPVSAKTQPLPLDHEPRFDEQAAAHRAPLAAVETDDDLREALTALQAQVEKLTTILAKRKDVKDA